jgi:predicted nucleotide-binding protein
MREDSRLNEALEILLTLSESETIEILSALGLDNSYRAPTPGWSRERRLRETLDASVHQGSIDRLLALMNTKDSDIATSDSEGRFDLEREYVGDEAKPDLVFVVHGQNKQRWNEVGWLIDRVGNGRLKALVLEQESNRGSTIIEKFEDHAQRVVFAVAILTADDLVGRDERGVARLRTRQNTIFEVGYFFAKLGRRRVVLLAEPGVERLTQLDGVLYIELDEAGGWKSSLVREIRSAGLAADLNEIS